jgi:hypothetical protein
MALCRLRAEAFDTIWSAPDSRHGLVTVGAGVVELVDTPDLGSGDESRGGSSPSARTNSDHAYRRLQVRTAVPTNP